MWLSMKYLAMISTFASESRVGSPNGWCGSRALPAGSQRVLARAGSRRAGTLLAGPVGPATAPRGIGPGGCPRAGRPRVVLAVVVVRAGRLCLAARRAAVLVRRRRSPHRRREAAPGELLVGAAPSKERGAPRRYQGVWLPLGPAAAAGPGAIEIHGATREAVWKPPRRACIARAALSGIHVCALGEPSGR